MFAALLWVVVAGGALAVPAGPTITSFSPTSGPGLGGTVVTLIGTGFQGTSLPEVSIGGNPATNVTVNSDTSLTITTPPFSFPQGGKAITVTVDGQSFTWPAVDYENSRFGFSYSDFQPSVGSVSPSSGPVAGGTTVTITGDMFTGASGVYFGGTMDLDGTPVTSFTVVSDTTITAVTPAGVGITDIYVANPTGTSNCLCGMHGQTPAPKFTYIPVPVVTSLQAMTYQGVEYVGYNGYGTITLTGTGFTGATAVNVGATPAISFTVVSDTSMYATAPAGAIGTSADVTVTTPGGTSAAGHRVTFGNTAQPGVSSISPSSGPTTGGTPVTITGSQFTGATSVEFGGDGNGSVHGTPATSYTVVDDGTITAIAPAGTGTVKIFVRDSIGVSNSDYFAPTFTYSPVPTITSFQIRRYKGVDYIDYRAGNSLSITGTGFTGATSVQFGTTPATSITVLSDTSMYATSPGGTPGTSVDVTVTTPGGTSGPGHSVTYGSTTQPGITSVSPATGPATGGTLVTITGSEFTAASGVYFGGTMSLDGTPATSFTVVDSDTVTAIAPPGTGTVDVFVVNSWGDSNCPCDGAVDAFTYYAVPVVSKLVRNGGSTAGGDTVILTGSGFAEATEVAFGTTTATSFIVDSDTQITAVSPAGSAPVNVTVTTPNTTSATAAANLFYYGALPPTLTSVTPSDGPEAGGTTVTITGASFTGTSAVLFGTTPASSFTVDSDTQITAVSPQGTGTVDVFVDAPCCVSAANGTFTYIPPGPPQDSINAELVQQQLSGIVAKASGRAISGAISSGIAQGLSGRSTIAIGSESAFMAYAPEDGAVGPFAGFERPGFIQNADWSAWLAVQGSGLLGGGSGRQLNVTAGVGYRFTEDFVAGIVGGQESFSYSSTGPSGLLSGSGLSAGAYLGWRFSDQGMFDAAIVGSALGYDITSGLATGSFDASRWLLTSGVTGEFELGDNLTISPSARVFALWEHQEDWVDSLATAHAARSFSNGTASGGANISGSWMLTDDLTLRPYFGLFADYQFDSASNLNGLEGRVTGGLNFDTNGSAAINIGAELGGLGSEQGTWALNAGVSGGF